MNPFISHSQLTGLYVSAAVSMVIFSNSIRRRHHLTRSGILSPDQSPWRNLYENGDNQSFLNLTGFSREAFEEMHTYLYGNELDHLGPGTGSSSSSDESPNVSPSTFSKIFRWSAWHFAVKSCGSPELPVGLRILLHIFLKKNVLMVLAGLASISPQAIRYCYAIVAHRTMLQGLYWLISLYKVCLL
jgi:hypothetical protein